MNLLSYLRFSSQKTTAAVAKERLQIIVAHERSQRHGSNFDFLPKLQQELLEVVRKYVVIQDEHIKVNVERNGAFEVLEVNIALPEPENRQIR